MFLGHPVELFFVSRAGKLEARGGGGGTEESRPPPVTPEIRHFFRFRATVAFPNGAEKRKKKRERDFFSRSFCLDLLSEAKKV